MNAHISPLMRKILADPVARKQLSKALEQLDGYSEKSSSEKPTVTYDGVVYEIKTGLEDE